MERALALIYMHQYLLTNAKGLLILLKIPCHINQENESKQKHRRTVAQKQKIRTGQEMESFFQN